MTEGVRDRVAVRVGAPARPRPIAARAEPERDRAPEGSGGPREHHPLAPVLPLLRDTLVSIADETGYLLVVTDARGRVLWRAGRRDALRRAERSGLVEGAHPAGDGRAGDGSGGDGPAATGRDRPAGPPVHAPHPWTGAARPVHDPDTGEVVGAVDVSAAERTLPPTALALVTAAVRLVEGHLAAQLALRDQRLLARNLVHLSALRDRPGALLSPSGRVLAVQPAGRLPAHVVLPRSGDRVPLGDLGEGVLEPLAEGWLLRLPGTGPAPRPVLSLPFLGAEERPWVALDGRPVRLAPRSAEVLALLALHPDGLSADELAVALHGDAARVVAVRAEVHRLHGVLDPGVLDPGPLRTRPHRLRARVDADFVRVRADLAAGAVRAAARAYRGTLLPRSEAPGVREERERLAAAVRRAVLDSRDVDAMWALAGTPDGADDVELAHRLLRALPPRDARRPVLTARITVPAR